MYPYILCFCGRSIGDLYAVFCYLRSKRLLEASKQTDATPDTIATSGTVSIQLGDIMDALGLHTECCRTHIQTCEEFKSYY